VTVHHNIFGITTVGKSAGVLAGYVVGSGKTIEALLLHICMTRRAMLARANKTTHGHTLTNAQIVYRRTDSPDGADNFMLGHNGVIAAPPVVLRK